MAASSSSAASGKAALLDPSKIININLGILGHVDSGKTSLVKALSTELSTASLDKNPQSQARGITLDLGFSAFMTTVPDQLAGLGYEKLQFTLVDCPGHASLIRTIIGGAQIIDMMLLVVDIVKGVQTQTAECLVIGEITTDNLIVVLNKVDLLPEEGRDKAIEKAIAKVRKVLATTKFADAPFITLSAAPGGAGKLGAAAPLTAAEVGAAAGAASDAAAGGGAAAAAAVAASSSAASAPSSSDSVVVSGSDKTQSSTVKSLVELIRSRVRLPQRSSEGPFLFAIDHCFPIKGQGTVVTGTVLSGSAKLNDNIEFPHLKQERKIKSIQMFKKPVQRVREGDRAGICVANLDSELIERGIASAPGAVPTLMSCIALVKKVKYFKGLSETGSKFHISIGHSTVMASVYFFGAQELSSHPALQRKLAAAGGAAGGAGAGAEAAPASDKKTAATVGASDSKPSSAPIDSLAADLGRVELSKAAERGIPSIPFDWAREYEWQEELAPSKKTIAAAAAVAAATAAPAKAGGTAAAESATTAASSSSSADSSAGSKQEWQWAALLFDTPVLCPLSAILIGSRLDSDINANACRIAFHGRVVEPLPSNDVHELRKCNIFKRKVKQGTIDRIDSKPEAAAGGGAGGGAGGSAAALGPYTVICKNVFSKETDMDKFAGMKLHTKAGQVGVIDSSFGKSGKFKATFPDLSRIDQRAAAELGGTAVVAGGEEAAATAASKPAATKPAAATATGAAASTAAAAAPAASKAPAKAGGAAAGTATAAKTGPPAAAAATAGAAPASAPAGGEEKKKGKGGGGGGAAGGGAGKAAAASPFPSLRAGDPVYLRFKKYMFERKDGSGVAGAGAEAGKKRSHMVQD